MNVLAICADREDIDMRTLPMDLAGVAAAVERAGQCRASSGLALGSRYPFGGGGCHPLVCPQRTIVESSIA
jgi:hypothetical protein